MSVDKDQLKLSAAKAQQGDKVSLEYFLKTVQEVVRAFVKKRLYLEQLQEDASQEILLAIYKALPTYDAKQEIFPWLFTIMRRRLIDVLRKYSPEKVKEVFPEEGFFSDLHATEEMASFNEFLEFLETLPERSRKAIELVHLQGKTKAEAADELGVSEGNVRVILHRAVKQVKTFFK